MKILTQITTGLSFLFLICGHTLYDSFEELCVAETTSNTCQEDDYIALRALYLNTDGDNWSNNSNWPDAAFFQANPIFPSGIDMESWYGITLNVNGCVDRIDTPSYITGTIPPEIGNLTSITSLNISISNGLTGPIPPEIGNLVNLTELSIFSTQISGNIPPEFGNLINLEYVRMEANQLSGSLPPEIGNLNSLEALRLFQNQLSGSIPPEIGNLSNLQHLQLQGNQLTGSIPSEIGNLSNLYRLDLGGNQLSGSIPPEIGDLSNLKELYLAGNQLSDSVPGELGNPAIEELTLFNNQLNGCYAPNLINLCSSLDDDYIDHYSFSYGNDFDRDWDDFCNFANKPGLCPPMACQEIGYIILRTLYLETGGDNWNNNTNWPNAAFFNANSDVPTGIDISTWYGVTTDMDGCITQLDMANNNLTGSIPPVLGDLQHLTQLSLNNNQLNGCYLPQLMNLCNQLDPIYNTNTYISDGNNLNASWEDFCDNTAGACILSCLDEDYIALRALYLSTAGHQWTRNNYWPEAVFFYNNPTRPAGLGFENWYGVTTGAGGCVTELYMYDTDLTGTLPPQIGNLSNLIHIRLAGHRGRLSGNIPPEIGNLSNLITLRLSANGLSGNIPPEIGNLTNLTQLDLGGNVLSGNIPLEITNLINLTEIDLNSNYLSGNILPEIGNLLNLTRLSLGDNQLTGSIPPVIGNLANLTTLNLSDNQLSGCHHFNLQNLCGINWIAVDGENNFDVTWGYFCNLQQGICPPGCEDLSYAVLRELYLTTGGDNWTNNTNWPDSTFFSLNPISSTWQNMNSWHGITLSSDGCVTEIDLNNNNLTGSIPADLADLTELTTLNLSNNQLSGCYETALLNLCGQLSSGSNTNTAISDGNNLDAPWEDFCNGLEGICSLTCQQSDYLALRALYLSTDGDNWTDNTNWPNAAFFSTNPLMPPGTNVNDWYGISTYDDCVFIISMTSNNMIGPIPPEIEYLTNPKNISFTWNSFNGSIPPEIGNLTSLTGLGFWGNDLSGSIPPEIGNLINLESLNLNDNELTGSIPSEIGNLTALLQLRLAGNMLSGSIPPEIGNLTQMDWLLDLSSNQLSGNIPPDLGSLYNLELMYLDDNQLTGSIPPEFQYLYSLERLELQNNLLTGTIPGEMGNMTSLTRIFLENNNMSGCFDSNLSNWCFGQFAQINIDSGNNFDVYWSDFCYEGVGMCLLPCDEADYIALRALYLSTNGDNWTNNTNWPNSTFFDANPTLPTNVNVATWYGVSTDGSGCVNALDLSGNNLNGTIPVDLKDMTLLTQLELYNNQLNGCYPFDLLYLCTQLDPAYSTNAAISNGNNLDTDWESFCSSDAGACTTCQREDYIALRSLYLNTDGDNWHNRNYWPDAAFFQANPTLPFGLVNMATWHGIGANAEGCVNGIGLCCNNLTGSIPPEIGNIENLSYMEVIENHGLTGTIPGELGNLNNLTLLLIDYSSFSGCYDANLQNLCSQIPDFDFNINAGNYLDALWSDFCGTGAGTCTANTCQAADDYLALRALYLNTDGDNWYDNTNWPNAAFFTANPTLPTGTDMNSWYGISADASSGCVKRVYLPYNNLVGNIPLEIGNLLNLRGLYLQNNQLTGNIPAETGNLSSLNILYLANNQLSGEIPTEIANLASLRELYLHNNQLSGCFEPNLQNLCGQMTSYYYGADNAISDGNNFEATWTAFCQNGVSACCPPLLTIDGVIPANIYQSGDEIISSGTVPMNGNVEFKAEQLIKLDTNFTIEINANFSAEIEDCGN